MCLFYILFNTLIRNAYPHEKQMKCMSVISAFIRGILALFSIWFMFFGYIGLHDYEPSAVLFTIAGMFLLAMAYEVYAKPLFFLVPISSMLDAYLAPADSKAIVSTLGMISVLSSSAELLHRITEKRHLLQTRKDRSGDSIDLKNVGQGW